MKLLLLGSSVTAGYGCFGYSFADYLAKEGGFAIEKEAVSGTTLALSFPESYLQRLRERDDLGGFDFLLVQLSTNDASRGAEAGRADSKDPYTTGGAINAIIDLANESGLPVAFFSTPRFDASPYRETISLMKEIAARREVPFLNLAEDESFLAEARQPGMYLDSVHPTRKGHRELLGPAILSFLRSLEA